MVNNCQDCQEERQQFYDSFESDIPYITLPSSGPNVVRKFPADTPEHLLKWHEDEEDRILYVKEMTDWKFQFDNELPQTLHPATTINIPKGKIHRIIKGTGDLVVEIRLL